MEQVQERPAPEGAPETAPAPAPAEGGEGDDLLAPEAPRLDAPRGAGRDIPSDPARRPSYVFLAVVSLVTLVSDVGTKIWAERNLEGYPGIVHIWNKGPLQLDLILAKNRGGAWGLLQSTSENVRRPFFLLVSIAAIAFIVSLYRRLLHTQRALKWGLPLVLGGALGNVYDRIRYGHVIDFIDVHVLWKGAPRHWPTFNVADIAICVGVGLMAIDMFSSKKPKPRDLAVLSMPTEAPAGAVAAPGGELLVTPAEPTLPTEPEKLPHDSTGTEPKS